MAGIAIARRRDVARTFSRRIGSVVASHANPHGRGSVVYEQRWDPRNEVMTLVTIKSIPVQIRRCLMVGRFVILVRTLHVTACAVAGVGRYTNVVPARGKPGDGAMAAVAGSGCLQSRVVARGYARGNSSVMAGRALCRHCGPVVELGAKKA